MNVIQKMRINNLANLFYRIMGYSVEEGYDFSKARHPTERMVWEQAKVSEQYWRMVNEAYESEKPKKKRRSMKEISEDIKKNNERPSEVKK